MALGLGLPVVDRGTRKPMRTTTCLILAMVAACRPTGEDTLEDTDPFALLRPPSLDCDGRDACVRIVGDVGPLTFGYRADETDMAVAAVRCDPDAAAKFTLLLDDGTSRSAAITLVGVEGVGAHSVGGDRITNVDFAEVHGADRECGTLAYNIESKPVYGEGSGEVSRFDLTPGGVVSGTLVVTRAYRKDPETNRCHDFGTTCYDPYEGRVVIEYQGTCPD